MGQGADMAKRSGGRAGRRIVRASAKAPSAPYIIRSLPSMAVLDEEGLSLIESNADALLQDIGIEFRDDAEVLDLWRGAGAEVKDQRVRFPKGLLRQLISTAPAQFTQHARNPARNVEIGGNNTVFAPVYGPPFVRDLDGGRRYGTIEDFRNFVKLAYQSPHMHHSGGTVCEPVDLPVNKRHLDMVYSHLKLSDKPFMGSVTAPDRAQDSVDMAKLVFGDDFVEQNVVMVNLINANSPLLFDGTMLGALKVYARHYQACIVSPFILSGAMSPVTVAGTLAQLLAEAMAGIALTQIIRPGVPVIFGTFVSSISMQSGAPTFGTPESGLLLLGAAQLARRLKLPFRSGGSLCGGKITDAQSAYESANTLQATMNGGVNFVLHGAGWLEGGLCSSYEKFVMDCDQLGMMAVHGKGIDLSENGQALDAIHEVGPGGHFLGCAHTQKNFEQAFFLSDVADNNSFEQWEIDGSLDTTSRANALWKKMLASYEAPNLDPGIDDALAEFIARKKAAVPDSAY
ncbi:MAG: trimethylamine methyltransferase family protein [Rhodospirillaceae bacterium]|nr:trimethylamine methyltransferase family protein [Rhodospirillaceae bacterium]MBT4491008.1 trimethylamine methyltransferase family protein [Rhodospirillaceae bacterium]MBT5047121.1 trimethylamine methyltransferase family protein [Rhodospirillaceae bacterium]MBT7759127.1 trimethylamine methyltransferase family protein [Rhodospirillaceae bacterium]